MRAAINAANIFGIYPLIYGRVIRECSGCWWLNDLRTRADECGVREREEDGGKKKNIIKN